MFPPLSLRVTLTVLHEFERSLRERSSYQMALASGEPREFHLKCVRTRGRHAEEVCVTEVQTYVSLGFQVQMGSWDAARAGAARVAGMSIKPESSQRFFLQLSFTLGGWDWLSGMGSNPKPPTHKLRVT